MLIEDLDMHPDGSKPYAVSEDQVSPALFSRITVLEGTSLTETHTMDDAGHGLDRIRVPIADPFHYIAIGHQAASPTASTTTATASSH